MNNRERAYNILHFKPVDRLPAVHFGYWSDLLEEWAAQGKIPADLAVGKDCVVVEAIDNLQGSGAVTLDGKTWTARTEDETIRLPENSVATVLRIEGVKLIVAPKFGPTQG